MTGTESARPGEQLHGSPPDTCHAPIFDQFAQLAATVCSTPMAAVTFFAEDMQWIKGATGMSRESLPCEKSFCIHTVRAAELLVVPDTLLDERLRDNDLVRGDGSLRFYAGVPLLDSGGTPVGALCVVDTAPRPEGLPEDQRGALQMLADQASLQLQLQQALAERDRAAEEARRAIADLKWATRHDPMTGLGNRALLRETLSDVQRSGTRVALLAIDVDHFKRINDSYGHQAGDELLKQIGRRLTASVRPHDVVIRLGGDEFAVVVRDADGAIDLQILAERLLAAMQAPIEYDGRILDCRLTIGGAHLPSDAGEVNDLVRFADAALCEAKALGRGRYVRFEPRMLAEQSRRLSEIARAQQALCAGSIVPYYQPKVDIADGTILGVEALLRVHVPGAKPAAPDTIAAAFEEPELAQEIGEYMLARILKDMQGWTAAGLDFGRVAINVSATEIGDPTFATRLLDTLRQHRIAPDRLEIEILEGVLLDQRSGAVLDTVRILSNAGVTIAFDDFGTGYAALAHLPKFPLDVMKIDRSFVARLDLRANQAIVAAILSVANELNLEVVAEGVETISQAAELLRLGCSQAQGFLYHEALPASEITSALLARRGSRAARPAPVTLLDRHFRAAQAA